MTPNGWFGAVERIEVRVFVQQPYCGETGTRESCKLRLPGADIRSALVSPHVFRCQGQDVRNNGGRKRNDPKLIRVSVSAHQIVCTFRVDMDGSIRLELSRGFQPRDVAASTRPHIPWVEKKQMKVSVRLTAKISQKLTRNLRIRDW